MEGAGDSPSPSSFVSKARTAFHSAASRAERVLDIKSPRPDSDSQSQREFSKETEFVSTDSLGQCKGADGVKKVGWRPPPIGTKKDWQDRFRNIRRGKKGSEESEKVDKVDKAGMAFFVYDENLCYSDAVNKDFDSSASVSENPVTGKIPSSSVVKQLAVAIEHGRNFKSMKDFLASSRDSSPSRERSSLSLSAMKSLVLRDKEDKNKSDFGDDETKVISLIQSLFDPDRAQQKRNETTPNEQATSSSLPREIHGAPFESLVIQITEIIGSFKCLRNMTLFWFRIVNELRRLWYREKHIPGIPTDEFPDLGYCLLYQQLQVINTCLSRKTRRDIATEALDNIIREASLESETSNPSESKVPPTHLMYARLTTGELVLRLGVDHPCEGVTMLDTGESVYAPVTQEGPLLTEDVIRETEEFVLRTGSVGAGCSQLLSDMQAFKAANPGCILEDFVRWHSPPDWSNSNQGDPEDPCDEAESVKGQLSTRMQKEGNLWRELWETSKPVPAYKQAPLFDEDLAVEGILNHLEDMAPSMLFEQLFISLVGIGFVLSESLLSTNVDLLKLFTECKDYTVATFQSHCWSEKVDDLCQVYETIETMLVNPEEVMKTMKLQEAAATTPGDQPKRRFRRLSLYFGKDKLSKKPPPSSKVEKGATEEPVSQSFSNFFESRSSLFSRKSPKPVSMSASSTPADGTISSDDGDWTVV